MSDEIELPEPMAYLNTDCIGERYLCFSAPTGGVTENLYTADQLRAAIEADRQRREPMSRDREVWRAALTLANNICVQESDRYNDNDATQEASATGYCAQRIRDWIAPTDEQLAEIFEEASIGKGDSIARDAPQPAEQQSALTKYQPCGCVICTCEHETQCQGCGAKHCGTHPVGQIPGPVYQQPRSQKENRNELGDHMNWTECKLKLPEPMTEVLVWIDGKRGPSWKNNHALVAYMAPTGEWFEERHTSRDPLAGVLMWAPITDPGA